MSDRLSKIKKLGSKAKEKLQAGIDSFRQRLQTTKLSSKDPSAEFDAPEDSGPSAAEVITSKSADMAGPMKIAKTISRPPLEKYYPYIIGSLIGMGAADLATTAFRVQTIPSTAPPTQRSAPTGNQTSSTTQNYAAITQRNPFNSDGVIPDPIGESKESENVDGPAVPTQLPLKLLGTIVHANPAKSVATMQVNSGKPKIIPYIPNDDIESMATLLKVERGKAFIRNSNTGRLEYVELKVDGKVAFGLSARQQPQDDSEVRKKGDNQFELSRSTIDSYINNISDVLQQARAVPNKDPATGEINGFKVLDLKPGSIYEKLGIQRNDVIEAVNGSAVNSPQKAMEMYQNLKNADKISIRVNRGGQSQELSYSVTN